jgi:hypothetical protein
MDLYRDRAGKRVRDSNGSVLVKASSAEPQPAPGGELRSPNLGFAGAAPPQAARRARLRFCAAAGGRDGMAAENAAHFPPPNSVKTNISVNNHTSVSRC